MLKTPLEGIEMTTTTLTVEIPEEIVALLGGYERALRRAREAAVLDLLRSGEIGESLAATLLGLTRWDLIDLTARHQIISGPERPEELEQELQAILGQARNQQHP